MNRVLGFILAFIFRFALSLRYRVEIRGLDKLNPKNLNKPGGVLFLPNHPAALIDPSLIALAVFPRFPIRPLVIEYLYFTPIVHGMMKSLNALPVPNFESSNNSLKRKRYQRVLTEVIKGLKQGENFLLYPAGRLKHTRIEQIGGASATQEIVHKTPEANIVLVRIKGLWGSSFSRALTGTVPPLLPTLKKSLCILFKNFFFFAPRRRIIIEFEPAPAQFPYQASRIELNRWLERWYNRPDGLNTQEKEYPGESLMLTSYSFWKQDLPQVFVPQKVNPIMVHLANFDHDIQDKVLDKLAELTELKRESILPQMSLSSDLGLDSLDISELAMYLQETFTLGPIPIIELTSVEKTIAIAAKQIVFNENEEEEITVDKKWQFQGKRKRAAIYDGDTMIDVFLNVCSKISKSPAYADSRSGVLTYSRVKLAVCLLAEKIRHMPGKYIGILLPASVGAFVSVLAIQLAGKIPVMINWTIGPRHLKAIKELSQTEAILTSWAFIERLDTVDLTGIDDKLIMLETVRREFSFFDKIRGFFRSKKSKEALLKDFKMNLAKKEDTAVLLFTSGTESLPKGVPLSHDNILSNQRAALQSVEIYSDDVLLAFLPPFHSFGFCITGMMGLFAGVRTAFYPNPVDGKGLAKSFKTWGGTITCGAPTFIKGMLKAATPHQLDTMRLCVIGAERAPPELFQLITQAGKEGTLLEGYGITECSPIISANLPGQPLKGVGKPLCGIEVIVVHPETYEKLPFGEEGLFLVRGPNVFKGYLNPGLVSPFLMIEGEQWYNTGDIGTQDKEGYLTISGRKKRFLKAGGEMVSLQAIETVFLCQSYPQNLNFDSARQSQIEALRSERQSPSPSGKDEEEDQFGKVVASQNSKFEGDFGISAAPQKNWPIPLEGPILGVIGEERAGSKPHLALVTTFDIDVNEANQILRQSGFSNLIRIAQVIRVETIPLTGTGKIHYRYLEEEYFKKD